jgi:hypothetical protein
MSRTKLKLFNDLLIFTKEGVKSLKSHTKDQLLSSITKDSIFEFQISIIDKSLLNDAKQSMTKGDLMVKNKHVLVTMDHVQRKKSKKCLGAEVPMQWRRAR